MLKLGMRWIGLSFLMCLAPAMMVGAVEGAQAEATDSSSSSVVSGSLSEAIEPVVVTGSKKEKGISNAPVKTEMVSKEVIERHHLSDLSQVLDNIPGITLQSLTGRLGRAPVIQGLSDERVLVLIDGVPQLQVSASGYDLTQLSVNDIERVEVVKGAASSLYGSQAMGGVINVITKRPTDKLQYSLDVKTVYSPDEQIESMRVLPNHINANLSGNAKGLFLYKLSLGHRRQGAIDLDESTVAQDMGESTRYNVSAELSKRLNARHEVTLSSMFVDEDLSLVLTQPAGGVGFIPMSNDSSTQSQSFNFIHQYSLDSGSHLKSTFSYSKISDQLNLNDSLQTSYNENLKTSDLSSFIAETQYDTSFFTDQETTMGLQYRYQFLDQNNLVQNSSGVGSNKEVDEKILWSAESYIQHSIKRNALEVTPGVRGQYDSDFGAHASPSINMIYSPNWISGVKSNLRSSVGVGYRIPSLKERFYLVDHRSLAGYIIEGDPNLDPERSLSYQLGLELIKRERFSFHINGFINNITGMIGTVQRTGSDGGMIFSYENLHEVQSRGVEITTSITPFKRFTLEQDLTLSKTENTNRGYEVPRRPRTLYKMRAHLNLTSKILLSSLFRFQSDEFLDTANTNISPSYSVLDLTMNYNYDPQLKLYAGVENVFDKTRKAAQDGEVMFMDNRPVMGRQFYVGLNYKDF